MSVDRTSYLLYGFKVEDEKQMAVFDDHYEELMEEKPFSELFNNSESDQTIIFDYMCGNYTYIGIKLAEADEYDDDGYVEIDKERLNNVDKELKEHMKNWPDYLLTLFNDVEPKLYFFIHAY